MEYLATSFKLRDAIMSDQLYIYIERIKAINLFAAKCITSYSNEGAGGGRNNVYYIGCDERTITHAIHGKCYNWVMRSLETLQDTDLKTCNNMTITQLATLLMTCGNILTGKYGRQLRDYLKYTSPLHYYLDADN